MNSGFPTPIALAGPLGAAAGAMQRSAPNRSPGDSASKSEANYQRSPCKVSDAQLRDDIAKNDPKAKYDNPCKPPDFVTSTMQPPGLPAIPVPPPIQQPPLYSSDIAVGWKNGIEDQEQSASRAGYTAAVRYLRQYAQNFDGA